MGLAFISVYFFKDRQRVGETLVNWWVEEAHTPSGRRRWSYGHWGGKKWQDPEARRQAAALEGWGFPVLFGKPEVRQEARARVAKLIEDDTRVLVGHSLGSVLAYEALCANPDWPVRVLVTLGPPLGSRT